MKPFGAAVICRSAIVTVSQKLHQLGFVLPSNLKSPSTSSSCPYPTTIGVGATRHTLKSPCHFCYLATRYSKVVCTRQPGFLIFRVPKIKNVIPIISNLLHLWEDRCGVTWGRPTSSSGCISIEMTVFYEVCKGCDESPDKIPLTKIPGSQQRQGCLPT